MLSRLQYKKLDDKGVVPFTVKENTELEILTENVNKQKDTKFFSSTGTFYGELVAVKVYPIKNGLIEREFVSGVGLMVKNESGDGCWIVPASNCRPLNDEKVDDINPIETVNKEFEGVKDFTNSNIDILEKKPEKIFGFTYKQLLIIGLIAIIIRKI